MRVLLVNPPVISVREPWFDEPDFVRTSLAYLAGYLRKYSAHEISCLDAKFQRLNFEQSLNICKTWKPDVVGFTAFTNEIKPAAYLAGLIKKSLPEVKTIIGGAHITALPVQTLLEFPTFDVGVFGEGEETLLELVNALSANKTLEGIRGVVYRNQNLTIVKNDERPRILDQESIPIPAWDMMPPSHTYYTQTVRGCPFNCVFCMNHNGKVARKRSTDSVIQEMEYLIQRGAKRISFGDELFSVDMKRTAELLEKMIQYKVGERVLWDIQTHVAYVNDELFAKMKAANIYRCEMGVETGDDQALKRMGKAINKEMIVKAFRSAAKHKIVTGSFLLIGQPFETHHSIWKTIKIGIAINPTEPIIGTMVPYPGTEVAKMAAAGEGGYRIISTDWDNYSKQINGALEFTNISKRMLDFYQIAGYVLIFLMNGRIIDLMKFFWKYRVAGMELFRKVFFNKKELKKDLKPADYDQIINTQYQMQSPDFLESRKYWKKVQSEEVKMAKSSQPNLLLEQMPIR